MSSLPFALDGRPPVFGMILRGGSLGGARVRDIYLANELHRRGFPVHAWWAIDRPRHSDLHPDIPQHWLFCGARYTSWGFIKGLPPVKDHIGRLASRLFPPDFWIDRAQARPEAVRSLMTGLVRHVCRGVESEPLLIRRFARQLAAARVTHLLPNIEILIPWALAARDLSRHAFGVLATFHSYELYVNYVLDTPLHDPFIRRLADFVTRSDWPAIAVSHAYLQRIVEDLHISADSFRVIYPGVRIPSHFDRAEARRILPGFLPGFNPQAKLIAYFGRIDAEKGIDLLLYAASVLRTRSLQPQIAIVGHSVHGDIYREACRRIAQNLRLPVLWHGSLYGDARDTLYAGSDVVVYPSIHCEPCGMVPIEAMAFGTPVVVADAGGVAELVEQNGLRGGLRFRTHDTASLADALASLLTDPALWSGCSHDGPIIAASHSVEHMTDSILAHLGINLPLDHPSLAPSNTEATGNLRE